LPRAILHDRPVRKEKNSSIGNQSYWQLSGPICLHPEQRALWQSFEALAREGRDRGNNLIKVLAAKSMENEMSFARRFQKVLDLADALGEHREQIVELAVKELHLAVKHCLRELEMTIEW